MNIKTIPDLLKELYSSHSKEEDIKILTDFHKSAYDAGFNVGYELAKSVHENEEK